MKISPYAQGTLDWFIARAGIPTASEFDALITPKWEIRTGVMPRTYLHRKLAEAWQNAPMESFNTLDMEFGSMLEDRAKPWFEAETGIELQSVGLCTTDDGRVGCSPDGLIGDDSGIEIKCPARHTHVGYVLGGKLPEDYELQVHGAMFVTGRPQWRFLSYDPIMPKLMLTIPRDEEKQEKLKEALDAFLELFDRAWAKLCDKNGGPPKRTPKPMPELKPITTQLAHVTHGDDIIP